MNVINQGSLGILQDVLYEDFERDNGYGDCDTYDLDYIRGAVPLKLDGVSEPLLGLPIHLLVLLSLIFLMLGTEQKLIIGSTRSPLCRQVLGVSHGIQIDSLEGLLPGSLIGRIAFELLIPFVHLGF